MKKITLLLGIWSIICVLQSCDTNAGSRTTEVSDSMAVQNIKQGLWDWNRGIAKDFSEPVMIDLPAGEKFVGVQFVEWCKQPIITTRKRYKGEPIDTFNVAYCWTTETLNYTICENGAKADGPLHYGGMSRLDAGK